MWAGCRRARPQWDCGSPARAARRAGPDLTGPSTGRQTASSTPPVHTENLPLTCRFAVVHSVHRIAMTTTDLPDGSGSLEAPAARLRLGMTAAPTGGPPAWGTGVAGCSLQRPPEWPALARDRLPVRRQEAVHVKFRVDRDVLADAVAWTARSLPIRPSVPVLSGLLIEASRRRARPVGFDYETSARATLAADVADEGNVLVSGRLLADICRSLPSKPVDDDPRRRPVGLTCGARASASRRCRSRTTPRCPTCRRRPAPCPATCSPTRSPRRSTAAGRDDMLPVLTGVRIEIAGSTISMLATDRFRLADRELEWRPQPRRVGRRAGPGPRPRRHRPVADRGQRGHDRAGLGRQRRGHDRVRAAPVRRHPTYDDPAARRRVPQGPQPVPQRAPDHARRSTRPRSSSRSSASSLVAERNTPVQLAFGDGTLTLEAGPARRPRPASRIEATIDGDDITIGFNPPYLLDGLQVIDEAVVAAGVHGEHQAGRHQWFDGTRWLRQ